MTWRSYTRCRQTSESRARTSRRLSQRGENLRRSVRERAVAVDESDHDDETEETE